MPRSTAFIVVGVLTVFSSAFAVPPFSALPITNLDDVLLMPTPAAASNIPSGPDPALTDLPIATDFSVETEHKDSAESSAMSFTDLMANSSSTPTTVSETPMITVVDRDGHMHELAIQDSLSAASLQADMYIAVPKGVIVLPSSTSATRATSSSAEEMTLPLYPVDNSTDQFGADYSKKTMPSEPDSSEDDVSAAAGVVYKKRGRKGRP